MKLMMHASSCNAQVELVEVVSVHGEKQRFAERSDITEVPLICPWSEEAPESSDAALKSRPNLAIMLLVLLLENVFLMSRHFTVDR